MSEEFLVVMPHTSSDMAYPVAERIRQAIQRWPFKMGNVGISATVSIGVASYPAPGIENAGDLLKYTDDALYKAKRAGKNRTVLSKTVSLPSNLTTK
jgi:diguanylate cyclase (GGDEF)-like protein